jgi:hypothetical protein
MPSKTKRKFKYIMAMRRKYKSKKKAPSNMKWVFKKKWTDVNYKDLPESLKTRHVQSFIDFINDALVYPTTV